MVNIQKLYSEHEEVLKSAKALIPFLRKWLQAGNRGALREHAPPIVFSNEEEVQMQTQETMEMLKLNI